MSLNERVIARLREEKDKRQLTMQDIATFVGWNRTKVVKKFGAETALTLDEFEQLCFAVSLLPSEAVRDRGLEFSAEMTPTELRLLELIRKLPKSAYEGLLHFLQMGPMVGIEQRGVTARRQKVARPRRGA